MKLLIVIVSYKVTDLTIDCLRSVAGEIGRVPGAKVAVCENGTGPEDERKMQRGDRIQRVVRLVSRDGHPSQSRVYRRQ